jgi:hypothetical protein
MAYRKTSQEKFPVKSLLGVKSCVMVKLGLLQGLQRLAAKVVKGAEISEVAHGLRREARVP